jgi:hypothetical protein
VLNRTDELVRGDLIENGAEVAEGVLAGADGEHEDEEHWNTGTPTTPATIMVFLRVSYAWNKAASSQQLG